MHVSATLAERLIVIAASITPVALARQFQGATNLTRKGDLTLFMTTAGNFLSSPLRPKLCNPTETFRAHGLNFLSGVGLTSGPVCAGLILTGSHRPL